MDQNNLEKLHDYGFLEIAFLDITSPPPKAARTNTERQQRAVRNSRIENRACVPPSRMRRDYNPRPRTKNKVKTINLETQRKRRKQRIFGVVIMNEHSPVPGGILLTSRQILQKPSASSASSAFQGLWFVL